MKTRILWCLLPTLLLALTEGAVQARYYQPQTGRFQTMDSYEGSQSDPQSLHKFLYAQDNPANSVDPSGHLAEGVGGLLSSISLQFGVRSSQGTAITLPGHVAARGFMKWAWLAAGIGAGVQYLAQDTQLGMEIQIQVKANPTASPHAYENYRCVEFAVDAERVFRDRGKQPRRIIYQSRPWRTWGDNIMAAPGFGFYGGENISINGHHEGVLVDGRVYDNNVPFGVPRAMWESGYWVASKPENVEMTIGRAARPEVGVGDITVR